MVLYYEDFTANTNKGQNGTTLDTTGVIGWTIDVTNGVTFTSTDYFKEMSTGYFESYNTDAVGNSPAGAPTSSNFQNYCVIWTSSMVDISCKSINFSVDLGRSSANSASGCKAYYTLNGGSTWVEFGSVVNTTGCADNSFATFTVAGLTGTSAQVKVAHWGTSSTPKYRHDNVKITASYLPTTQVSAFSITGFTGTTADLSWTNGSGDKTLVIAKEINSITTLPENGNSYTSNTVFGSGDNIGNDNFVVYDGTGTSITVTGLDSGSDYVFFAYSYNTSGPCYNLNSAVVTTSCTVPSTQVSSLATSSITSSGMTISWTNGSGDKTLVVARRNGVNATDPEIGTTYTANSMFGHGDEIGSDNFVVYSGTGSSVSVSSLAPGIIYYFNIYSFNSAGNCYNLTEVSVNAKTTFTTVYEIDVFNGANIVTRTGTFTDSNPSGNYGSSENYYITFSSGDDSLIKFSFTLGQIAPGDTLYIYDGPDITSPLVVKLSGNAANSNKLPYFKEANSFTLLSSSSEICFQFKSDGAKAVASGWSATISTVSKLNCSPGNPDAADLFGAAPIVCNLNGYCGKTSGDFGNDFPGNLNKSGGSCPSALNFVGTVENNSWLKFQANATQVDLDFTVPIISPCINGIQAAVFDWNGSNLNRMTECALSDGSHSGNFSITATGLTAGNYYYIMVDGNAGDICNYTINSNNSDVVVVDAGADQIVCEGNTTTTLTATAPGSGNVFTWSTGQTGSSISVTPAATTSYSVTVSGSLALCGDESSSVLISVDVCLPIELRSFDGLFAGKQNVMLTWTTASERNNSHFLIQRSTDAVYFVDLAIIQGSGNSGIVQNYTYQDTEATEELYYYRLIQTDFDGTESKSEIINVKCSNTVLSGLNFNHLPGSSEATVEFNASAEEIANVTIVDPLGRVLHKADYYTQKGRNEIFFRPENFTEGINIIIVTFGGQVYRTKFLK